MRLGLIGGTFDPIHFGHLLLAERCREECGLDRVWFLPAGQPPHKAADGISPGQQRAELVEFAIAGHPQFAVNRLELGRAGRSFTIDTLSEIHAEDPSRELFFLIGADSLADLPGWRDPAGIVELATIVAVNRGDRPLPDLEQLRRRWATRLPTACGSSQCRASIFRAPTSAPVCARGRASAS